MKKAFFYYLFFAAAVSCYSFQWPVAEPVLVTAFAESKAGTFSKGIELQSPSDSVYPIAKGEAVFFNTEKRGDKFPSPMGNYIVIQHERGIFSYYGHLGSVETGRTGFLETERIGTVGSSGSSRGNILLLVVLDGEFEQYINPLLSLPPLPDSRKPEIRGLYLSGNGKRIKMEKGTVVKSGIYNIQVEIRDFGDNTGYYCPLAPYSISLYINGENKEYIKFETLKLENGEAVLQNSRVIPYEMMYADPWTYRAGNFELSPGDTRIELAVKDFEGNESSRIVSISVVE